MLPKEAIILGGGASIQSGIEMGLWDKLQGKFVIGTNFSYKYFTPTVLTYVDKSFYETEFTNLKDVPLIIGQNKKLVNKHENTISIPCSNTYTRNLSNGIYTSRLVGMYALSLAIYLVGSGSIYLLGYDMGAITKDKDDVNKPITHFYQKELKHRGTGKVNYYERNDRDIMDYKCYEGLGNIEIYNVSPKSNIRVFPKITYDQFFSMLMRTTYDQTALRSSIIEETKNLPKA